MNYEEREKKIQKELLSGSLRKIDEDYMEGLDALKGSIILDIGWNPYSESSYNDRVEGGLSIDYEIDGEVSRIVFGYTEIGEWIEAHGSVLTN